MKRNRLIIIGVGRVGGELLRRLPKDYDLLCIDNAPDAEERVKKLRADGVAVMQADATSRLVLKEARVNDAEGPPAPSSLLRSSPASCIPSCTARRSAGPRKNRRNSRLPDKEAFDPAARDFLRRWSGAR